MPHFRTVFKGDNKSFPLFLIGYKHSVSFKCKLTWWWATEEKMKILPFPSYPSIYALMLGTTSWTTNVINLSDLKILQTALAKLSFGHVLCFLVLLPSFSCEFLLCTFLYCFSVLGKALVFCISIPIQKTVKQWEDTDLHCFVLCCSVLYSLNCYYIPRFPTKVLIYVKRMSMAAENI